MEQSRYTLYTVYGLSYFYSHPNHQLAQSITASAGVQASKEGRQYLALNNALCFVTVLRLGCVVCALADYMHVCVLEWLVPLLSERVVST